MTDPRPTSSGEGAGKGLTIAVAVAAGLVVVIAAIVLPLVLGGGDDDRAGDGGDDRQRSATDGSTVDTSNLDLVEQHEVPPYVHVQDDVTYPQSPPVGGDHWDPWLECGVYDVPVLDEYAVHDLEHGTIWLTYREDLLDADEVGELADQLPDNGIMSPYPDQEAPVVITAWGHQLELVGADDPRIALFVDEYAEAGTAPEAFASCAGGTTDPDGPDLDGTAGGTSA